MRRISPTQRNANVDTQPALENESESAGKGGDDAEKPRKSSCSLDLTEEGGRGRETEMSASSPSFVNIDSSSTDVSAASVPVTRAQVIHSCCPALSSLEDVHTYPSHVHR